MSKSKIFSIVPIATVMILAALPAQAQTSVGFGFSRFGRHSGFGIGFSTVLPQRCWVPGHWETACQQVWVPGVAQQVWVEPVYHTCMDPCGNVTRVMVRQGYYQVVEAGGHWENRYTQVWVPGHYR